MRRARKALKDRAPLVRVAAAGTLAWADPAAKAPACALMKEGLRDRDAVVRARSATLLGWLESADRETAVALGGALADRQPAVRRAAAGALASLKGDAKPAAVALKKALEDEDRAVRASAAEALSHCDPRAREAVPVLIEEWKAGFERGLARDPREESWAARSLVRFGAGAVPGLIAVLKDRKLDAGLDDLFVASLRAEAALLLGEAGKGSREAAAALGDALNDDRNNVRATAAIALRSLDPKATEAIPLLVEALKEGEFGRPTRRVEEALVGFGAAAVPHLAALLKDRKFDATDQLGESNQLGHRPATRRGQIAYVLGQIGLDVPGVVPALLEALKDRDLHWDGLNVLKGGHARALPALRDALEDKDVAVRLGVAEVLAGARGEAKAVATVLLAVLKGEDAGLKARACAALADLDEPSPEVLDALAAALKDEKPPVRRAAALALGRLGTRARPAVPKLLTALKDKDRAVREAAAVALSQVDPGTRAAGATEAIPVLVRAMKERAIGVAFRGGSWAGTRSGREEEYSMAEGLALQRFGAEAVEAVVAALRDQSLGAYPQRIEGKLAGVRASFAFLLGTLGEEAREAVPALKEALRDPDRSLRREAAVALSQIDPGVAEAVPVLLDVLRTEARLARMSGPFREPEWLSPDVCRALVAFGAPSVKGLVEMLQDETLDPVGAWYRPRDE